MHTDVIERASMARPLSTAALLTLIPLIFSGCGFGTAGLVGASGGGSGGTNGQAVASDLLAPRSATSPATVLFVLRDQENDRADVALNYRTSVTGEFRPITLATGSASLKGVRSSTTPYEVQWDFAADLGAGYHEGIELQMVVTGGIAPQVIGGIKQGNDAPTITQAEPSPAGAAEYSGNTDITFTVADTAGDTVRVKVEYNELPADAQGNRPASGWKLARPAATPGGSPTPEFAMLGVATTKNGAAATFRWDTELDLAGFDDGVRVRLTPVDDFMQPTSFVAFETGDFRIDNNAPPQAVLDGGSFFVGIKDRGSIPVPFQLFDEESDSVKVLIQWRASGQPYSVLPTSPSELIDLLENPARAADRRQLQVAVEAPLVYAGRVEELAGLASNQVRLHDLAGNAAGLLTYGLVGRSLEILRPSALQPVAWPPTSATSLASVLASNDGATLLVLSTSGSGWRVQELDLVTGDVLNAAFATGNGSPRALSVDPSQTRLFVGSDTGLYRFDRGLGTPLGSVSYAFSSGMRGLAALGTDVAVATGDSKLVKFNLANQLDPTETLLDGLSTPWGVVVDPLDEGSIYLAEQTFVDPTAPLPGRVSAVNLDELQVLQLPARVAPGDIATLGSTPFPRPQALALENGGARLIVVTNTLSTAQPWSLRTLALRSPVDRDGAPNGLADPFVGEVKRFAGAVNAVATAPGGLRVACLPARLEIGGGVAQRRTIVAPYMTQTQVVLVDADFDPVPRAGTPWRISAPLKPVASPDGPQNTFVWNTADLPDPAEVQIRVVPIDSDVGSSVTGSQLKSFRTTFDLSPSQPQLSSNGGNVVAADLDGDGDLDLFSGGELFFQSAPGIFPSTPDRVLAAGNQPVGLAADLTGDGLLDLVYANVAGPASSTVRVFVQGAPGVFPTTHSFELVTAEFPRSFAAADLNGDGLLDLAVGCSSFANPSNLKLFFQVSPGNFNPTADVVLPGTGVSSLVAGDLNGDGILDLAATGFLNGSSAMRLFFQPGSGFQNGQGPDRVLVTGDGAFTMAVADLDGDGDNDLVTANSNSNNTLTLFFQSASGVFSTTPDLTLASPGFPGSVQAADLDGDGDLDLVVRSSSANNLRQFFQSAPGVFSEGERTISTGANSSPHDLVAADLNGDGVVDLVAKTNSGLKLFFQSLPGAFSPTPTTLPTGNSPFESAAADLDGDGDTDLVSVNTTSSDLVLMFQVAPGVFTPGTNPLQAGGECPKSVAAVDLNGDGRIDIVSSANGSSNFANYPDPGLRVRFQTATPGVFPEVVDLVLDTENVPESVIAADLNGDGLLDLACVEEDDFNFEWKTRVFYQSAPGIFPSTADLVLAGGGRGGVVAADLQGNGRLDLITQSNFGGLSLYLQPASGFQTGQSPVQLSLSFAIEAIDVADLDGDGDFDLVIANGNQNNLTLLFQNSTPGSPPSFPTSLILPTTVSAYSLAAADLDADGDTDLVAASSDTPGRVTLFFQGAPGVFVQGPNTLPTGSATRAVGVADLDSDGDLDIYSTDMNSNILTLFFGGR